MYVRTSRENQYADLLFFPRGSIIDRFATNVPCISSAEKIRTRVWRHIRTNRSLICRDRTINRLLYKNTRGRIDTIGRINSIPKGSIVRMRRVLCGINHSIEPDGYTRVRCTRAALQRILFSCILYYIGSLNFCEQERYPLN